MNDEQKQPKEYDLVLGGNNPPPTDGSVLGGIKGLKLQFGNANSEEKKIAILQKALSYGEAEENWLFDIVATEKNKIQWLAAVLLSNTKNEVYKELLLEYFAEFIPNNIEKWNEYKRSLPDFEINLSRINLSGAKLQEIDLSGVNLNEADLSNSDLSKTDLTLASFIQSNLLKADLSESNLFKTNLSQANLKQASMYLTNIKESNLGNTNLTAIVFHGGQINRVDFSNSKLLNARFDYSTEIYNTLFDASCYIKKAWFIGIDFRNVTFNNVNLQNIYFMESLFINVVFDNCNLMNAVFHSYRNITVDILFKKCNLENSRLEFPGFTEVKFERVNLKGANFKGGASHFCSK